MEVSPYLITTLLAAVLIHGSLAAAMYFAYRVYGRRVLYFKHWALASALVAAGYCLYALIYRVPLFFPLVLGNGCFVLGMNFVTAGAAAITGRERDPRKCIIGIVTAFSLLLFFTYIFPLFVIRNLIVSLAVAGCSMVSARFLLSPSDPEDRKITLLGARVFIAYAVFYLFRSTLLLWVIITRGLEETLSANLETVLMLGALVLFIFLGISFFTMMGGLFVKNLEKSLERNRTLLREIQHRTKNNIALVSSLVSLQEREVSDPAVKKGFSELKKRLDTITTVYQMLGQVEDGQRADARDYLSRLCAGIRSSIISSYSHIIFDYSAESYLLDSNDLIPLGLVLNELIFNALKHAFPDNQPGSIRVSFTAHDGECLLEVSDNGVGLNRGTLDDSHTQDDESIGMLLINTLAKQLKGDLTIAAGSGEGTRVTLRFVP